MQLSVLCGLCCHICAFSNSGPLTSTKALLMAGDSELPPRRFELTIALKAERLFQVSHFILKTHVIFCILLHSIFITKSGGLSHLALSKTDLDFKSFTKRLLVYHDMYIYTILRNMVYDAGILNVSWEISLGSNSILGHSM